MQCAHNETNLQSIQPTNPRNTAAGFYYCVFIEYIIYLVEDKPFYIQAYYLNEIVYGIWCN